MHFREFYAQKAFASWTLPLTDPSPRSPSLPSAFGLKNYQIAIFCSFSLATVVTQLSLHLVHVKHVCRCLNVINLCSAYNNENSAVFCFMYPGKPNVGIKIFFARFAREIVPHFQKFCAALGKGQAKIASKYSHWSHAYM